MNLDEIKTLIILGDPHTGKTNLAFYHLNKYKGRRKRYLLGYPKKIRKYITISNFQDIHKLRDSIIFIDELQNYINAPNRQNNRQFMELISLFHHYNNTLIGTLSGSNFINKGLEGFIDAWNMTRIIDLNSLKNGSKPKRIIQHTMLPQSNSWSLNIDIGEYLHYSDFSKPEENTIHKFKDQKIGKDWKGNFL